MDELVLKGKITFVRQANGTWSPAIRVEHKYLVTELENFCEWATAQDTKHEYEIIIRKVE